MSSRPPSGGVAPEISGLFSGGKKFLSPYSIRLTDWALCVVHYNTTATAVIASQRVPWAHGHDKFESRDILLQLLHAHQICNETYILFGSVGSFTLIKDGASLFG